MQKTLAILCSISLLWGCQPAFQGPVAYKSQSPALQKPFPATVAVLPLEDKRGKVSSNKWGLAFVPVLTVGTTKMDRPEAAAGLSQASAMAMYRKGYGGQTESAGPVSNQYGYPRGFNPSVFLQNSLAEEFGQSRLFEYVVPVQNEQQAQGADLVLKGQLFSTRFRFRYISYGLGIFTAYSFWVFGLPMCTDFQQLAVKLELFKPGDSTPLWTGYVDESMAGSAGYYYKTKMGREYFDCRGPFAADHGGQILNEILAPGMAKATASLAASLRKQPSSFWEELQSLRAQKGAFRPQGPGQAPEAPAGPSSFQKALEQIQKELGEE